MNTVAEAEVVAKALMRLRGRGVVFACDTEVADIEVTSQSPCCHGTVTCLSIYAGPGYHFGSGRVPEGGVNRSIIWVDTMLDGTPESAADARAIFHEFAPFLASPKHPKVWHNYGFDRHVLQRIPALIEAGGCQGFAGDTMHMARLWNAARAGRGYSLESLTSDPNLMGPLAKPKRGMRAEFERPRRLKNGGDSKVCELPDVRSLQLGEDTKWRWVRYSAIDARATWELYQKLRERLEGMQDVVIDEGAAAALRTDPRARPKELRTMWDVYTRFWKPFGELLTVMEDAGMPVDRHHLELAQARAEAERDRAQEEFRAWASERVPDAKLMNVGSGPQISQLLFAGAKRGNVPGERTFKVPNPDADKPLEEGEKRRRKYLDMTLHCLWGAGVSSPLVPATLTPAGQPQCNSTTLLKLAGKPGAARAALDALGPDEGNELRVLGDLESLATSKYKDVGELFPHFGTEREGLRACAALGSLVEASSIDTLLSSFIVPLQSDDISRPETITDCPVSEIREPRRVARLASVGGGGATDPEWSEEDVEEASGGRQLWSPALAPAMVSNLSTASTALEIPALDWRVHCSMNINTETGRLSARCPNLQNQPALEKDRYKVRKAFATAAGSGRTLIVADYSQLELRVLAHMANCTSMIEAFEAGGDFHSRTALGMYPEVAAAVERGECVLERSESGPQDVPLIKDVFSSQRRRAKVLNFSIAYGKTEHGLSRDWGVSLEEAKKTVELWYEARPEVKKWQEEQRNNAETLGYVTTMLGRRRPLPDAKGLAGAAAKGHALRAAINSPVQGSAADIAMAAMLRISRDELLKKLGWRLLLQIHDEVILEGPRETAEEARQRVVQCMERPFSDNPNCPTLRVALPADSNIADSWFEAK